MNIDNKVALVTGANRGIGRALVEALLHKGARRVYAAARKADSLRDVVALDDERVTPVELDITDGKQAKQAAILAHDTELLINNAGVAAFGNLLTGDLEMIERDLTVNYLGTLNVIRAFVPVLENNGGGAIVNVLSLVSLVSMPGLGGYSASKAASHSVTQAIRGELAAKNIQVHGVYPGPVDTDMIRGVDMPKTSPDAVARAIVEGVASDAEDIFPDPMAQQTHEAWLADHKAVERQFGSM